MNESDQAQASTTGHRDSTSSTTTVESIYDANFLDSQGNPPPMAIWTGTIVRFHQAASVLSGPTGTYSNIVPVIRFDGKFDEHYGEQFQQILKKH